MAGTKKQDEARVPSFGRTQGVRQAPPRDGGDVVTIDHAMILWAIDLHRLHSLSFWDALIVRAASSSGCVRLLTGDLEDGRSIDGVRIENPFSSA